MSNSRQKIMISVKMVNVCKELGSQCWLHMSIATNEVINPQKALVSLFKNTAGKKRELNNKQLQSIML